MEVKKKQQQLGNEVIAIQKKFELVANNCRI
jgi:hypothetical protein